MGPGVHAPMSSAIQKLGPLLAPLTTHSHLLRLPLLVAPALMRFKPRMTPFCRAPTTALAPNHGEEEEGGLDQCEEEHGAGDKGTTATARGREG